jgi:hypothetical protein
MRLVQATREPTSAAALIIAMLQVPGQEAPEPRWGEGWSSAAARYAQLRQALLELPMTSRRPLQWPLLELAVARLRMMSPSARQSLLETARAVVVADGRLTLREWIYFTLLRVRLMSSHESQLSFCFSVLVLGALASSSRATLFFSVIKSW